MVFLSDVDAGDTDDGDDEGGGAETRGDDDDHDARKLSWCYAVVEIVDSDAEDAVATTTMMIMVLGSWDATASTWWLR